MEKIIGQDRTVSILGQAPETILLPKIPELVKDAKSTAVYDKQIINNVEIPKDKKDRNNFQFIKELYKATLNRIPTEEELSKWMNALNQAASREGIYRAIVLSTAYDELEKYQDPPTDRLLVFTKEFLSTYINLKVEDKALQEMNLYSIKRICVEKSLELIDIFLEKPDSLFNWYAVLSGHLAKEFGSSFEGEVRKNLSLKFHRNWASSVPTEYIKSEIIIKLHKAFNALI